MSISKTNMDSLIRFYMYKILLLLLLLCSIVLQGFAQPGTLDLSFNGTGVKETTLYKNLASETIYASVIQADGKVLVVGKQELSSFPDGFVARLLTNGDLDPSFGDKGIFLTSNISGLDTFIPLAIALDDLGGGSFEIVLAGYATTTEKVACAIKLTSSGVFKSSFGNAGSYLTPAVTSASAAFNTLQIHPSTHNIILAGTNNIGGVSGDFLIASLTSAGVENYAITKSLTSNSDEAYASVLNGDVLYLGGTSKEATSPFNQHFSILSINVLTQAVIISNVLPYATTVNRCYSMKIASDGKIVMSGRTFNGTTIETLVYRLLYDGTPDSGLFGANGYISYDLSPGFSESMFTMHLDANNDIVLGGNIVVSGGSFRWKICRISYTSGLISSGFNMNSIKVAKTQGVSSIIPLLGNKYLLIGDLLDITSNKSDGLFKRINNDGSDDVEKVFWVSDANTIFYDAAVDANGKIWACGNIEQSKVFSGQTAFIARFNTDGTLDGTFTDSDPYTENGIQIIQGSSVSTGAYALEILSNGQVLVAGSSSSGSLGKNFFITRLNYNGSTDLSFNGTSSTVGRFELDFYGDDDEIADIALQGNKILLYGYATTSSAPPIQNLVMIRLNADGTLDNTFRMSNALNQFQYMDSDMADLFFKFKVQSDNKIVGVGTNNISNNEDMLVFRLLANGEDDTSFDGDGYATFDFFGQRDNATCVFVRPDGKILVGGITEKDFGASTRKLYAMLQLNTNGSLDPTFSSSSSSPLQAGMFYFDKGASIQGFTGIYMENSNTIVAVGVAGVTTSTFEMTALRFNQVPTLDNTFNGLGYSVITSGLSYGSFVNGSELFVVGCRNTRKSPYLGVVAKVKLGVGVPTLITNMVMSDVYKTYGDANFFMRASSNSPANIKYGVLSGSCANIDANTGEVNITCAGPVNTVTIRAVQQAVQGFTADTVDAVITIAKATPKIIFKKQGGVIGDVFTLEAKSNTDATPVYVQLSGLSYLTIDGSGSALALSEGSATTAVTYAATDNYITASAVAEIYSYIAPIDPLAVNDNMTLVFGLNADTIIDVLANDTGYTGKIIPELTDLDPEVPGIQNTYTSPSLGAFFVDDSGLVRYVPFQGFIGSGKIYYTIQDSRGGISLPAEINVSVQNPAVIPALKSTELFTPNGDGLNDAFVIGYINPDKSNFLKVFDRSGRELFTQVDYKNDWEGYLENGDMLQNGTYYFLFVEGTGSDKRELSGFVELKK